MARRKSNNPQGSRILERVVVVVLLGAVAAAFYFNYLAERLRSTSGEIGDFDVLGGVKFVDHGVNDGDSFHARHGGTEYVFRLYFVDSPEKSARRFRERLADQGEYFGGLSEDRVVELGLEAKDYVDDLMRRSEMIKVYTRWEEVYDSGRYYALVEIDGRWLSELLIEHGLARIHTKGVNLPDGEAFKHQREDLRELEAAAKAAGRGGWSRR